MAMADPTRSPPSAPSQCPSTTPVIPMRAMTEIRDVVFFVAVILATQLAQIGTQYRDRRRQGERLGGGGTLMISRPPAGFVNFMIGDSDLLHVQCILLTVLKRYNVKITNVGRLEGES